jgi:hypothetical protein
MLLKIRTFSLCLDRRANGWKLKIEAYESEKKGGELYEPVADQWMVENRLSTI